jgi:hypothetical protein
MSAEQRCRVDGRRQSHTSSVAAFRLQDGKPLWSLVREPSQASEGRMWVVLPGFQIGLPAPGPKCPCRAIELAVDWVMYDSRLPSMSGSLNADMSE